MLPHLSRAGAWFLNSGIQEPSGGVARYYRADQGCNNPVSTEITGYFASTLAWLHSLSGDERYLEAAVAAARFLVRLWNPNERSMPFEVSPPAHTYFFDCGIILRGLIAVWRATQQDQFLAVAVGLGRAMERDFGAPDGSFEPVLSLPDRHPQAHDPLRWSQAPGCYQLKSALGWLDVAEATGDARFRAPYERALEYSLRTYGGFLPGHPNEQKVMDRLHAYLYFLEGLLPRAGEKRGGAAVCDGIRRVAQHLEEIAPEFARSDVYAQLLRMRMYADAAGVTTLDRDAAAREAAHLAAFQAADGDARIDGSYWFGRRGRDVLPYANPVSTAFAAQALAMWEGVAPVDGRAVI
ncbi:MAG TPA: hypothetical protein VGF59_05335 [Bryobacteraceae bacterium]